MASVICGTAPHQPEYSICGVAFDSTEEDEGEQIELAESGQTITCPECRRIIDYMKAIRRYKEP